MTLVESAAGLPDLQPTEVNFIPSDPADETAPWTVSVTVVNAGDEPSAAFRVTLLRDGLSFATIPQFGLAEGGEIIVSGTLCGDDAALAGTASGTLGCTGGLASGVYEIRALVDSAEEVIERDEQNNSLIGSMSVQALELRPRSLTFDRSPVRLNDDVKLTATVENAGRGSAEAVQVAFYVNGKQLDIQSVGPIGYLGTAKAETVLNAARLGFVDAPAAYDIQVVVDPHDALHETDEDNNALIRSMSILEPLAQLPELMPRSLELYPTSPVELGRANELTVTSTILNSGRSAATDFGVRFFYRSKGATRWIPFPCVDAAQCSAAALGAGASVPFVGSLSTVGLTPGVYELRVVVDPDASVAELDERNNELATALTLQAAQLPDLVACGPVFADPSSAVRRGRSVTLSLCVANEGDTPAAPFDVRFTLCLSPEAVVGQVPASSCDTTLGYNATGFYPSVVAVPALAAGEQRNVTTRLETEDLAPGTYYVNVEIDQLASNTAGSVAESNEMNNLAQGAVFVVGPDLALVDLRMTPPSPVTQGQIIQVAAIVSNLGQEAAGQFDVSYYIVPSPESGIPTTGCAAGSDCTSTLVSQVLVPGLATSGFEQIVCNVDTTGLIAGNYVLRAVVGLVDVPGKVPEHATLNNVLEIPLTIAAPAEDVQPGPGGPVDLAIQSTHVLPNSLDIGETGLAWVLVSNLGPVPVGPFDVAFAFRDAENTTVTLVAHYEGTLEPGVTDVRVQIEFASAAFHPGNVLLTTTLDPAQLLPESDRSNNTSTRAFRVR